MFSYKDACPRSPTSNNPIMLKIRRESLLFRDEIRFTLEKIRITLENDPDLTVIWREQRTKYNNLRLEKEAVIEKVESSFKRESLWMPTLNSMYSMECTLTLARYRNVILDSYVRMSEVAADDEFIVDDDNIRFYRAILVSK
ncbi:hypothetical protein AVEN_15512-1 [Araneus ventricosus]|uniref:Uncharacterized protein n=1 Tax=Araneus ventricosus TaxID=182803 RepID=A0A4Y2TWR0_ARAVE|nr:hypothetical protein AVEN_15512-1 [Araneus ventricosus]